MRPSGPVPVTRRMSTPSSRAIRRTDGGAGGGGPSGSASDGVGEGRRRRAPRWMSTTSPRRFSGAPAGRHPGQPPHPPALCRAPPGSARHPRRRPPAAASARRLCRPSRPSPPSLACPLVRRRPRRASARPGRPSTLSPCLTLISFTVPSTSDGTSMVALSVSSSRTGWSFFECVARIHHDADDVAGGHVLAEFRNLEFVRHLHRGRGDQVRWANRRSGNQESSRSKKQTLLIS
jgi:hypothetical protein